MLLVIQHVNGACLGAKISRKWSIFQIRLPHAEPTFCKENVLVGEETSYFEF